MTTEYVKEIPSKAEAFSDWYTAVCLRAELADYSPVRGMMVIRPYGYAIWEGIQRWLDARFKATGHMNAAFPLLVPESLLQQEAAHVQGFAPQVAWVTQGGDESLAERLAVRPTSEAIMMPMYAKWIQSYRDLPVLIVQWNSVVRWEKATRLFLRTAEFLWHEGHTAHRTTEDADAECRLILGIYKEFVEDVLAIPLLVGRKPATERFAGADWTYTLEALMPDSQAIQAGTSHFLGQNFGRDLLGHLYPHHRRPDHGPRRRPRAGPATGDRALPGGHRADLREGGPGGAGARGGAGPALRPAVPGETR